MKAVVQRVEHASVTADGKTVGSIKKGLFVLLGISKDDTEKDAERIVKKLVGLRIFADGEGKTNLSLADVDGQLLIVSQFTLYADARKGNRPSFTDAAPADKAEYLYEYFISLAKKTVKTVEKGSFGAHMDISAGLDGPFTIILE